MIPIQVNASFEKIGIDLVGSLPVTSKENYYIIVAIDYLTKWAEARPITRCLCNFNHSISLWRYNNETWISKRNT